MQKILALLCTKHGLRDYQREEKAEPSDMSRANEPRLFRSHSINKDKGPCKGGVSSNLKRNVTVHIGWAGAHMTRFFRLQVAPIVGPLW
jgi:hypothetical protein